MTARSHYSKAVIRKVSGAPASGGTVLVCVDGTTNTPITQTLYADEFSTATLSNPFSFTSGTVDFYTLMPLRVKLIVTPSGGDAQPFFASDVWPSAGDVSVTQEGPLANRPAPGQDKLRYVDPATGREYYDTGTAWVPLGSSSGFENSFLMMGA